MKTAVGCTITKRITLTEPAGCFLFISRKDAKIREEIQCLESDAPLATQIGTKSAKTSGMKAADGCTKRVLHTPPFYSANIRNVLDMVVYIQPFSALSTTFKIKQFSPCKSLHGENKYLAFHLFPLYWRGLG